MSNTLLESLVGSWQGTCRTWFEPEKLADESTIEGRISAITPCVLEHRYESSLRGESRAGREWIAWNSVTGHLETTWVDTFHMNYGILISQGEANDRQASVLGEYAVGPEHPNWKWRTEFSVTPAVLTIISYNVSPDGDEAKAIEISYQRVD